MSNIIPELKAPETPNAKIAPLLCDIQKRIPILFCREMYLRKIGNKTSGLELQRRALFNCVWALQSNPEDDLVDAIECWFRERYNK